MVSHRYKYDPGPGHVPGHAHLEPASDELLDIPTYDYYIHQSTSPHLPNDDKGNNGTSNKVQVDMFGPYEPVECNS